MLDRARVAELIVISAGGRRRGSGYRVTRDAVLTAAHVVADAVSVEVRFEPDLPGEWTTTAVSWWADPDSDVAVLQVSPQAGREVVTAAEFGRIDDSSFVLDVQAVGFPRWKLRSDPADERFRDACHAVGSVATLSNWREGTLEVSLSAGPAADPGEVSPWEGMSGAALWAGNRIIGVISKHHAGDGPATLAAVRLDRTLATTGPAVRQALRNLLGLPERAAELPSVAPTGQESGKPVEVCPYPTGMAAFRPEQAEWFFGREKLTTELVARLDQSLLHGTGPLIVVAPSGAGKSSLLQAGLLTKLDEGALPGSRSWPRLLLTPTDQPMAAITTELAALLGDEPATVAEQLADDLGRFVGRLRSAVRARALDTASPRLLLIVDQLEELFTLCADKDERHRYIELLSRLAETGPDGESAALVVYGLRADFYARCADHPQLQAAVQNNQLVVGPMSYAELRDAIRRPAEHAGLRIEKNLVELLLRDLGATPRAGAGGYEAGRLPLMAHALRATWRERRGNTLTLAGYEAAGGIEKAVETTADGVYAELDTAERRAARTLFLHLVKLGDDTNDTRRRVLREELVRGATDAQRMREVLDAFTRKRLLTQHRSTVEITHEVLLRAWPMLRHWIGTGRSANLLRQELEDTARVWSRHDRGTAELFRGTRLDKARAEISEADLSPLGRDFLTASAGHERLVERSHRRKMVGGWSLAALTGALAAGLGVQLQITQAERDNAVFHQITAEAHQVRTDDPSRAAQLDLQAHRLRPDDQQLYTDVLNSQYTPLSTTVFRDSPITGVSLSADGRTLATSSRTNDGGEVQLWDLSAPPTPRKLGRALPADGPAALSADGRTLATSDSREVRVLDMTNPDVPVLRGHLRAEGEERWDSVALSADGRTLATGSSGPGIRPELRLWDAAAPGPPKFRGRVQAEGDQYWDSVALSGDGRTLATTRVSPGTGRDVELWDVSDPAVPEQRGSLEINDHYFAVSVALSTDGRTLVARYQNSPDTGGGEVRSWDISDPGRLEPHRILLTDAGIRGSVSLNADGRTIATSHSAGDGRTEVRLWDVPAPLPVGNGAIALSNDGLILATSSGANDNTPERIQLWDVSDPRRPSPKGIPLLYDHHVDSIALSGNGSTLAISDHRRGEVLLWNVAVPEDPRVQGRPVPDRGNVALNYAGDRLVTSGREDGSLEIWDLSNAENPRSSGRIPAPGSGSWRSATLSGDGRVLAATARSEINPLQGSTVQLWDIYDPARPRPRGTPLVNHGAASFSTALSGNGLALATNGSYGTDGRSYEIQLWDVSKAEGPQPQGDPLSYGDLLVSVQLSADGRTIVGSGHGGVRLWNIKSAVERICSTWRYERSPGELRQCRSGT